MMNLRIFLTTLIFIFLTSCGSDDNLGAEIPYVGIDMASSTFTSITVKGNIYENGNTVSSRGTAWSLESQPTVNDNAIFAESNDFEIEVPDLNPGEVYHFRNFVGETDSQYSNERLFQTKSFDHTEWKVTFTYSGDLQTGYKLFFQYGGNLHVYDLESNEEVYTGNWTINGRTVSFNIDGFAQGGNQFFQGELQGNMLQGQFTEGGFQGSFSGQPF